MHDKGARLSVSSPVTMADFVEPLKVSTPSSSEYQHGVSNNNLGSFSDNNVIPNIKIGSISRQHLTQCDNKQCILCR